MVSKAAHDQPGPHPERQRKRTELQGPRNGLIGLLVVIAVLAIAGGAALIGGNDGGSVFQPKLPPAARSHSLFGTGVLLALVIGGSQAIAALMLVLHRPKARMVALAAALIVVAWSIERLLLHGVSNLQVGAFFIGGLELLLVAGCTPRETMGRRKARKRGRG